MLNTAAGFAGCYSFRARYCPYHPLTPFLPQSVLPALVLSLYRLTLAITTQSPGSPPQEAVKGRMVFAKEVLPGKSLAWPSRVGQVLSTYGTDIVKTVPRMVGQYH